MKKLLIILMFTINVPIIGLAQLIISEDNFDYYSYNNQKDTLFLTKIDVGETFRNKSSEIIDTIQIDGFGSKEIIVARTYRGVTRDIKQASQKNEKTSIHKYEIWNIDTKTLIFEAIDAYEFDYEKWILLNGLYPDSTYRKDGWRIGRCSYKYAFSINKKGDISISKLKYENEANNCIADKKEGGYKFINGKYTYEK